MWRSLVARLLGVQEAVSSNLAVPIRYHQPDSLSLIGYDLQGAVLSAFFASPHDNTLRLARPARRYSL